MAIADRITNVERTEPVRKVSERQMRLWHALHDFCRSHGGVAVTSLPGHREIRIAVPKDSALPAKLSELGYQPHHCCTETRIEAGAFTTVDVISIMLPGK